MWKSATGRHAALLRNLGLALCVAGALACAPPAAEETATAAPGQQATPGVTRTAGGFELSLTGELEEELEGDAVCVFDTAGDELRVVMHPRGEGVCHYFILALPGYTGEGEYRGRFGVTGVSRSAGPADVALMQSQADVTLELRAEYMGAAGDGTAEGLVTCPLPS